MQPKIVNEHYHNASFQEIDEIRHSYIEGRIAFAVHKSRAVSVAFSNNMPKNYRWAMKFWFYIQLLCMGGGVIAFFVVHWLAGIGLFALGLMIRSANIKSAGEHIIDVAKEDRVFLKYALATGLIEVKK